jgi:hypothetical protein
VSKERGRRRKIVPISPALLYELFTVGTTLHITCTEGLPAGARFVGHDYDVLRDRHFLVFEADEWELILEAERLPTLNVAYLRHYTPGEEPA